MSSLRRGYFWAFLHQWNNVGPEFCFLQVFFLTCFTCKTYNVNTFFKKYIDAQTISKQNFFFFFSILNSWKWNIRIFITIIFGITTEIEGSLAVCLKSRLCCNLETQILKLSTLFNNSFYSSWVVVVGLTFFFFSELGWREGTFHFKKAFGMT